MKLKIVLSIIGIGCTICYACNSSTGKAIKKTKINKAAIILEQLFNPEDSNVLVVAHRGVWTYAPENSLEAIKRCIDLGVDIVELDVRKTKDGHLVVIHDKTVDRTTNGKGKVEDMTLREIKSLRLRNAIGMRGSRLQVPTLEEVMRLTKDKILVNIDKTEDVLVREAYEILKKTGTVDQAILKGNNTYDEMYSKYGSLMDSIVYMPKIWSSVENGEKYVNDFENAIDPNMYEVLFKDTTVQSFKVIPKIRENGDRVMVVSLWDNLVAGHTDEMAKLEGAEESYGWLIRHGANIIATDCPEFLLTYLRETGRHN